MHYDGRLDANYVLGINRTVDMLWILSKKKSSILIRWTMLWDRPGTGCISFHWLWLVHFSCWIWYSACSVGMLQYSFCCLLFEKLKNLLKLANLPKKERRSKTGKHFWNFEGTNKLNVNLTVTLTGFVKLVISARFIISNLNRSNRFRGAYFGWGENFRRNEKAHCWR